MPRARAASSATRNASTSLAKPPATTAAAATPPSSTADDKKAQARTAKKLATLREGLKTGPFPAHAHPTPSEALCVAELLSKAHGYSNIPTSLRTDERLERSVLDTLIHTVLSCNTNGRNSKAAHNALVQRFGKEGWKEMLSVPREELAATIKCGGLHERKSRLIRGILQRTIDVYGKFSLNHLHGAPSLQVMEELMSFNGVGPKVAACCSSLCIGNEELGIDTHVHRLSKALGWVPEKATPDQTFFHLAGRVPAELKVGLHILLIRHGKTCRTCKANAKETKASNESDDAAASASEEEDKKPNAKANSKEQAEQERNICVLKAAGLLGKVKVQKQESEDEKPSSSKAAAAKGEGKSKVKKEEVKLASVKRKSSEDDKTEVGRPSKKTRTRA